MLDYLICSLARSFVLDSSNKGLLLFFSVLTKCMCNPKLLGMYIRGLLITWVLLREYSPADSAGSSRGKVTSVEIELILVF